MLNKTHNILDRLAAADRTHQKEAGVKLLLRGVKYGCGIVLLALTLDVVVHLSAGWRLGLLLAMIAGAVAVAFFAWHTAFVRRNRIEHTARLLESRDPQLGSRLINLLQLKEQAQNPALVPMTRSLARQAVEGYASGLGSVPMEKIARTDEVRRDLRAAGWVVLGSILVLLICFDVTATELPRFADPFGDHPPYSFTRLAIVQPGPAGTTVAYGKGLVVKVSASGHQPNEVYLTSYPPGHPAQAVTVPMFDEGGSGFNQQIDDVRTDLIAYAHTKDHASESKQVNIHVILTPRLEKAFVRVAMPAYTNIKPLEKSYDFKGVEALEGSEVQFRMQSNRPLREGWVEVIQGDQPPVRVLLKKSGDNEVTGSFLAADSGRFTLGVVDVAGLSSEGGHEAGLTVTHDLPPEIHITNPEHDAAVAIDFKMQTQVEATDDYGLSEIRMHCAVNGTFSAPQIIKYDKPRLESREATNLDFAALGVHPGDVISLFAEAIDNAPQPHLSRSQTVHLTVISVEDYNNMLREQSDISNTEAKYAQLNSDLQDLMDQQKELADAAQKLSDQLAKADSAPKQTLMQQFDSLVAQQNELNQKLGKHAERMEKFVRQNPVYDVESDLQNTLRQEAQTVRESTQANDAAVKDVAQRSSPPSGQRQLSQDMLTSFKAAADSQVARLSQTHDDAETKVDQPLQDMSRMQELLKDFNLFTSLYKAQGDLTQQAQAYNKPGQLAREDQLALKDIAASEQQVGQALRALRAKLGDDSRAAHELFPKASRSGEDLADQIGSNLMEPLAEQATGQMLAGNGDQAFQLADRLRAAMERLFSQCQGGDSPSSNELDSYLQLHLLSPGSNFSQLSRSHRMGMGSAHASGGSGEGADGMSGSAQMDGIATSVMGNETFASNQSARLSSPNGHGSAALVTGVRGGQADPDVMSGLNPVNRHSAANAAETPIEEYNDVVDNYFKAIAAKKEKPANDKSN